MVVGPAKNDPPWRIASRYTTTFATISASVTNGNRSVGMLSFSGITRRLSLGRVVRSRDAARPLGR